MISIADKKFRGRDKIVQKMTKDGLVEENLRTGEIKSAIPEEKPEQEDSAKGSAEQEADEIPIVDERYMNAEDGEEDAPRHRSTAKQSADYYKAHGKAVLQNLAVLQCRQRCCNEREVSRLWPVSLHKQQWDSQPVQQNTKPVHTLHR